MKKMKKWQLVSLSILALFLITNPTLEDFKQKVGAAEIYDVKKVKNFLFFSVYDYDGEIYIGIMKNFIQNSRE